MERTNREYKEEDYQTIFGVKKETFEKEEEILNEQYKLDHTHHGRTGKLTVRERLEIYHKYIRQYFSQRYLAAEYGIAKSQISPTVRWVAKTLADSSKKDVSSKVYDVADLGYIGMDKHHQNCVIPIKASKNHPLSKDEKWYNREISKIIIAVEHVNAWIKKFKMFSTRYRGRRKNFTLFMSLICGTYNFEHANI